MTHSAPAPITKPDKDDKTWIVLLIIFGLAGIGGPILGLILFLVIAMMG